MALKIEIPNDKVANWMIINNRLHGKTAETSPAKAHGVVFYLTAEFTDFGDPDAGPKYAGLTQVDLTGVLDGTPHNETIYAENFENKHWLSIVTSGTDPMDPADYWKIFNGTLHNHVHPCRAGIILWRGETDEISMVMLKDGTFRFDVVIGEGGPIIQRYIGEQRNGGNLTWVTSISLKSSTDQQSQASGDPMNPPRYP